MKHKHYLEVDTHQMQVERGVFKTKHIGMYNKYMRIATFKYNKVIRGIWTE